MHATLTARLAECFAAHRIRLVDLQACTHDEPIHRAAGFAENAQIALRWRSA